ncbi:MAG: metal ABC transporter permease [Clostridiaceae bacterium]|nr:metal ABC transporter permease [Clostridiaceae bacterium]
MPLMFQYSYMQKAFVVGILLSLAIACLGVIVVHKRMSLIGSALSHSSLSGVAIGLLFGFNPILGAVGACLFASLCIEAIRKKLPDFQDLAVAITLSIGIGLAGVLSGFVKNASDFNSFLFGSIIAITPFELYLVIALVLIVLLVFLLMYKELFYISLSEEAAALSGVPVRTINFIFTILTALTVSIAARTVGALVISSLLVVPVAAAMQIARSFKTTIFWSIFFALVSTVMGLTLSFYIGLKPGGTIALLSSLCFFAAVIMKSLRSRFSKRSLPLPNKPEDLIP